MSSEKKGAGIAFDRLTAEEFDNWVESDASVMPEEFDEDSLPALRSWLHSRGVEPSAIKAAAMVLMMASDENSYLLLLFVSVYALHPSPGAWRQEGLVPRG